MTCLACHNPHDTPSDNKPAIADVAAVCKDCHNAHLEEGATAEAGTTLRHLVKEMIGGMEPSELRTHPRGRLVLEAGEALAGATGHPSPSQGVRLWPRRASSRSCLNKRPADGCHNVPRK